MREIKPCLDVDMAAPTHANGKKGYARGRPIDCKCESTQSRAKHWTNRRLLAQVSSKTQTHVWKL